MAGEFLPPQPGGREPDLGRRPAPAPEPYAPPAHASRPQPQVPQWSPAPAGQGQGQDNGPAVLGFILSLSSLALLLFSLGLSTLVSVGLAIPGMLQSRKGTRRVREGLTTRNEGLASAGWVIGIVALVLSALASLFWIVIAIVVATSEEARQEFEREFDRRYEEQRQSVVLPLLAGAARLAGAALL